MNDKDISTPGHGNRIKCIRAHPTDPNIIFSSGWDNTVKIYDIEKGYPTATMGGSEVTGDSIDIFGDMILTGSYRNY